MSDILQRLDLSYLANLLKDSDDEDRADEILQEYSKKHMTDSDDLEEVLAIDWNCIKCSCCGKFFGEDEMSEKIEDECVSCVEEELFYEQND